GQPRDDQRIEARRQRAGQRGQHEQRHAEQQRPAPSVAVGQRPVNQLPAGQSDEIHRQRLLHLLDIDLERRRQRRKAGQVEVHGQRPEGRQRAQDQKQTEGQGAGTPRLDEKAATLLHTLTIVNIESTMQTIFITEACVPNPMRRTKEDAEKTRAAILSAAEHLFLERGVAHTSLEHIARAAGVTRGAVYWHFQNKADLFNAMLNQVRLPPEQIAERLSSDPQLSLNSLRDMCILALQTLLQNEQKRQILTILMQRCEVTDELRPAMDRHNQFVQQVVDVFERLLDEAERHGQLHPGINARQ